MPEPPWCAYCEPTGIAGPFIHIPMAPGHMPAATMPPSCAVSEVKFARATTSPPAAAAIAGTIAGCVSGAEAAAWPLRPTDEAGCCCGWCVETEPLGA